MRERRLSVLLADDSSSLVTDHSGEVQNMDPLRGPGPIFTTPKNSVVNNLNNNNKISIFKLFLDYIKMYRILRSV